MINQFSYSLFFSIAIIISIYTQLRFGLLGLGELLLLLIFIAVIFKKNSIVNKREYYESYLFSRVFFVYIILCIFSTIFNFHFGDSFHGKSDFNFSFDLFSYCFVLIVLIALEKLIYSSVIKPERIFKNVLIYFFYTSFILYVIFHFRHEIGPFQLNTYSFFAPLVNNVHQFAMIVSLLPVFFAHLFFTSTHRATKLKFLMFSVLSFMMVLETNAFKAIIGSLLSVFFLVFLSMLNKLDKSSKLLFISALIMFVFFGVYLLLGTSYFINLFNEADGGGARATLYSSGISLFADSPVLGYGSGPHLFLNNEYTDAHQTFITILLQTGILGAILFLIFSICFFKAISTDKNYYFSLAFLIPILMYMFGGDILRKYQIWFFLCLLYYISVSHKHICRSE